MDYQSKVHPENYVGDSGIIQPGTYDMHAGYFTAGKVWSGVMDIPVAAYASAQAYTPAFRFNLASPSDLGLGCVSGCFANCMVSEALAHVDKLYFTNGYLSGFDIRLRTFAATPIMTVRVMVTVIGFY